MASLEEVLSVVKEWVVANHQDWPDLMQIRLKSGKRILYSFPDVVPAAAPKETAKPPARHSDDFRSVDWFGQAYQFSLRQAMVVQRLWEAWEEDMPVVSLAALLEAAESDCQNLRDLFRTNGAHHPAWGQMIVPGPKKGTYRLATP